MNFKTTTLSEYVDRKFPIGAKCSLVSTEERKAYMAKKSAYMQAALADQLLVRFDGEKLMRLVDEKDVESI